ncbi:hypothetical protein PTTG_27329 [Puccinia triticina 1-1 BBBD Race 1]|uniref:Uncharacterized protein n=1 Tax=Puccinia triticina (isolate 1-1 / race 1 (BBBD)) TaxID=630390 RepID=A0A180GLN6_PUCT1|nr:hypothetical protein PTTG_27329 [Puccinia triticina 1-1 BBBD Race 1]
MAQSSTSRTPSRPPSCRSTRITPVRLDPNFVRTGHNSHHSILVPPTPTQNTLPASESQFESPHCSQNRRDHSKSQTKKKHKHKSSDDSDVSNNSDNGKMDYSQDSDAENSKVWKSTKKKSALFDNILDYFEPPFHANEDEQGEKLMYKCRWCSHIYKKGAGTKSNLTKHRNGNNNRIPCSARLQAIAVGAKLPVTAKESKKGSIKPYLKKMHLMHESSTNYL